MYPNPIHGKASIRFHIDREGIVRLKVYDIMGREIEILVDKVYTPGIYTLEWEPEGVAGVYFLRLEVGGEVFMERMVLVQ